MDRQMYAVDASCAKCGAHIAELPFEPSGDRPVYCSTCNREFRNRNTDSRGGGFSNNGPKQMFDVDVTCAGCGAKITQLPFMPSGSKPIYCRDCMRSQRG
ncbi:MAG: hypothetical protein Q7J14_00495 [Candidatus Magasanikbacteria bacterium]|nr:hypothetical protein [Candidatus Magasanikbacteria bacterium]